MANTFWTVRRRIISLAFGGKTDGARGGEGWRRVAVSSCF